MDRIDGVDGETIGELVPGDARAAALSSWYHRINARLVVGV